MKTPPKSPGQLLEEFSSAQEELQAFIHRTGTADFSEAQSRQLISRFENTHELALQLINKYLQKMGKGPYSGSRDATVEAFHAELIDDGKSWLDMVIDRIQYNPVYELDTQATFIQNIRKRYGQLLEKIGETMCKKL